jgi:hypothetical protein
MTNKGTILSSTLGYEHHFTIPYTGTAVWELWNIQSATIKVLDGEATATPNLSESAPTASNADQSEEATQSPTDSTGGTSMITAAPVWRAGVGVLAGAMLGA